MGVLRQRGVIPHGLLESRAAPKSRDGLFESHQPRHWTVSSAKVGSHLMEPRWQPPKRPRPPTAHSLTLRNPANRQGKLSSEAIGAWCANFPPMVRIRPASDVTIQLRNPMVAKGLISSEPIGLHTGVERVQLVNRCRPATAPLWSTTMRTSDAIGTHPDIPPVDPNDAAAMLYEAQFTRRFGDRGQQGAVLASRDTAAAADFQKAFIERAATMAPGRKVDTTATDNQSKRADGHAMEKVQALLVGVDGYCLSLFPTFQYIHAPKGITFAFVPDRR